MQPRSFSSPGPYIGSGGPPSLYMGGSPYGSSHFNGSSMPPYDVPFSGGSPYHFNYNSRIPAGAHFRPLHMSGPPPYHGGSMMRSGMRFFLFLKSIFGFSLFPNCLVFQLTLLCICLVWLVHLLHFFARWDVWNASTYGQVWPRYGHGSCCCRCYGMYNSTMPWF